MAVNCASIPRGGPRPRRTCSPWQDRVARVGMGPPPPPPWGAEERFCGIGSLAKIWAEKFRDSGRSAPPCSPHAARLVQLLTSRIVTQEKTVPVPWGKRGSRHHSLCTTARRGCPTSTHTQYCEQKHGTAGRRGSLRPARSLKHSAAPEKPNKKNSLKTSKTCAPLGLWGGRQGWGGTPVPFLPPGERSPRCCTSRTGPRPQAARLLKGKACVWLLGACLSYRALPTSTTMAAVIYRFPE